MIFFKEKEEIYLSYHHHLASYIHRHKQMIKKETMKNRSWRKKGIVTLKNAFFPLSLSCSFLLSSCFVLFTRNNIRDFTCPNKCRKAQDEQKKKSWRRERKRKKEKRSGSFSFFTGHESIDTAIGVVNCCIGHDLRRCHRRSNQCWGTTGRLSWPDPLRQRRKVLRRDRRWPSRAEMFRLERAGGPCDGH